MPRTGHYAILEQLVADGIDHIFGNPGTVEQGLLDALTDFPQLRYILTLQETVAVLAADGYARSTQRPTIAQVHSSPGLGNAIGALYQAMRGHSPIVVLGGDSGIKYQGMDAQMAADLVSMARPVTKWSAMVMHPSSLLRVLRRAIKIAGTPPMGPVYVCLQEDVLDAEAVEPVFPTLIPSTRVLPDPALVDKAAELLARAQRPRIYIGDGVAYSGGAEEVTRVAELLGAEVYGVDSGEINMIPDHPLYSGQTGHMFGSHSLPIVQEGDVNLVVGTYMLPEVYPRLDSVFPKDAKTIHVDLNAYEIGKNHRVDLGIVSDPKLTMGALAEALEGRLPEEVRARARDRMDGLGRKKTAEREEALAADLAAGNETPLKFARFMRELAPRMPADAVIFDEALTSSPELSRYWPSPKPGTFFQVRGGSLGTALAGAIGLKVANPDKPVFSFSGDGGAMYVIQAFWSAARHNLDIKFIICSNRSYHLLQLNLDQFWEERGVEGRPFPLAFDLSEPPLRFVEMAQGMGMAGRRIERPEDIVPAIEAALAHNGPFVLDVVIAGDVRPERIGVQCGH
jgi:benzoylformate decarboxylase